MFGHTPLFSEMMEETTKHGINRLELMVEFIQVFESDGSTGSDHFYAMKLWLSGQIKRELTAQEDLSLAEGILKYIQSEPLTNERTNAMKYLFNAEFINHA